MADTARTKSALVSLFANNTTGDISAQDIRDFVASIVPGHGAMYISSSSATTISDTAVYYKVAGTTTATNLTNFSMPANNRLQYDGTPDIHVHVAVTVSYTTGASNNQLLYFRVGKSGDATVTDAVASTNSDKNGTGADVESTALHFDTMMSNGDYLELFVRNSTGTNNVTVTDMYFFVLGMMDQS